MSSSCSAPTSNSLKQIRILVADRNPMNGELLAESLGHDPRFEITRVAAAEKLLPLVSLHKTDVAVISVEFDGATKEGLQITRSLNTRYPDVRVVILLDVGSRDSVIASFRCGAVGVFCRTEPLSELSTCIERVSRGEIWASPNHSQFLLEALRSTPSCEGMEAGKIDLLSHRELQVAECAAQGQSNKQIADRLGLSEHTVKNYLFRIFDKLGVSNRCELLFVLFKECNAQVPDLAGVSIRSEARHPVETYLRAAEEGLAAAQYIVGLAHLEGYCVEKNDRSAYYWLRMAAESSSRLQRRSAGLTEKLRLKITQVEIEEIEDTVRNAICENQLVSKRPQDMIKRTASSSLLRPAV